AVNVVGCVDAWRWCDVIWGPQRGWIFARFLSMSFQNQPTVIFNSGAMLGVPLITFSVGNYWGVHYRNRPWWNNRNYWSSRPPTPRPPAAAAPPGAPPGAPPAAAPSAGRAAGSADRGSASVVRPATGRRKASVRRASALGQPTALHGQAIVGRSTTLG